MSDTITAPPTPAPPKRAPGVRQLLIVVVILAVGFVFTALTSKVTRTSEPGILLVNNEPFLPETAGAWKGGEQTGLTADERAVLPADTEGARRVYTDADGHMIYCAVVLAGADVTSIHRPDVCLKGQGWRLETPSTERVNTPASRDGVLRVARMNATSTVKLKSGNTTEVYGVFVYWFVGKDRTTSSHWRRIMWSTYDRVIHNRNHRWAYFLINAVVPPENSKDPKAGEDEAMAHVRRFIQDIYPQLANPS